MGRVLIRSAYHLAREPVSSDEMGGLCGHD